MKGFLLATVAMTVVQIWGTAAEAQNAGAQGNGSAVTPVSTDDQLGEIIVTAQQRSENLQRAAISVSAVGSDALLKANVTDANHLTNLIPAFRSNPTSGPYANFSIRGISNFTTNAQQDNAVVVNIGGVPLARPSGPNGMFYDLERVEVLKGPQGILYGRNATGGVVNLIPKAPGETFGGAVSVNLGNYDTVQANAGIDVPVSDTLFTRTAVQVVRHDGYYQDGTGDEDSRAARFSARWEASPDVRFTLVGDYAIQQGMGPGASLIYSETATSNTTGLKGFLVGPWTGQLSQDPRIQSQFTAAGVAVRRSDSVFQDNKFWGVTGTLEARTGIGEITAIAAHRVTDVDFESLVATFYNGEKGPQNQDSLEIRLASNPGSRLQYLFGGFFLDEKVHVQQINEQNTVLSNATLRLHNRTYAGFGQLTYSLFDGFRLSGGVRYNVDDKKSNSPRYSIADYPFLTTSLRDRPPEYTGTFVGTTDQSKSFHSTTWKAGFEYDAAPDSLIYGNVATGFKAGGFSYGPPGGIPFNPEHVTSYVLGSKNRFFDHKLQINIEAFLLKYKDQQVQFFATLPGIGNFTITRNVAASTIKGFEWDAIYLLTHNTRLNFSGQVQKGTYDDFIYNTVNDPRNNQGCPVTVLAGSYDVNCSGKDLVNAPRLVLQGGIDQTIPLANGGNLVASVLERYESSRQTYLSYLRETKAPHYNRTDLSLTYNSPDRRWALQLWVQNLENKAVIDIVNPGRGYKISSGGLLNESLQPPRTFGARGTFNF